MTRAAMWVRAVLAVVAAVSLNVVAVSGVLSGVVFGLLFGGSWPWWGCAPSAAGRRGPVAEGLGDAEGPPAAVGRSDAVGQGSDRLGEGPRRIGDE